MYGLVRYERYDDANLKMNNAVYDTPPIRKCAELLAIRMIARRVFGDSPCGCIWSTFFLPSSSRSARLRIVCFLSWSAQGTSFPMQMASDRER